VALARAVNYDSAGTVEFVAGQDRSFFFLEMNTRLQVEHPVTEMITGVDLVEQMIRVAAGEKLTFGQEDVRLEGWAVESRIYAEDPTRNFLPSIGRLTTYRPPAEGTDGVTTLRNDTGVEEGGEISIHYDPMIAKLVTHAPTRIEAIDAQARALDAFAIDGIRHNIPFLATLMSQHRWREGRLSTGYIAEEFPEGFKPPQPEGRIARRLAVVAADIDHRLNRRKRGISGQLRAAQPVAFDLDRVVLLGSVAHAALVETCDGWIDIHFGSTVVRVESDWRPGEAVWHGSVDGAEIAVLARIIANGMRLSHGGAETDARVYTRREAELALLMPEKKAADTSRALLCPMPGLVRSIAVSLGQEVKAGETLAIVEAMKMENVLRAERDVTIKALRAKAGDSLSVDAIIMEFA
ncbi:MAG: biotin/lipoyl-containing protein, partial [Beijerinckiaceae bacterium]